MPKRKVRQKPQKQKPPRRKSFSRRRAVVIGLMLCSGLAGVILAQWGSMRSASSRLVPSEPQTSQTPSLLKEYIYAGGKLVAIEEPAPPIPAPTNLVATTQSSSQIIINWTASTGNVGHYEIERSTSIDGTYTPLSANPTATNFTDTTAAGGVAYLYRVRAVDASGGHSAYSNADFATAISFDDDPLVANQPPGTVGTAIKAKHLNQLRQAVNAMRVLTGLGPATWTWPDPVSLPITERRPIYLKDVTELRTSLDAALNILGRLRPYETDPNLTRLTQVKAAHFQELRERVK